MGNLADWTALEDSGVLPRPPGRAETVAATVAGTAAKKAAENPKPARSQK